MQNSITRSGNFKVSVRLRDFFVDFLACLIPGFLVLSTLLTVMGCIIIIVFYDLNVIGAKCLQQKDLLNCITTSNLQIILWFYFILIASSYALGFLLFRQDPKLPDYASYLRNRNTVAGYNAWVIPNHEGLKPNDVQFPYSNLPEYLKARGFLTTIHWKKNKKSRSKAFINQLKTRISFFFPDSTFQIIKNEAHIRFSSSMWYGSKLIISLLYAALILILLLNINNDWKNGTSIKFFLFNNGNTSLIFFLLFIYTVTKIKNYIPKIRVGKPEEEIKKRNKSKKKLEKEIEKENKKKKDKIDKLTSIIRILDFLFNISPFIVCIILLISIYLQCYSTIHCDPHLAGSTIFNSKVFSDIISTSNPNSELNHKNNLYSEEIRLFLSFVCVFILSVISIISFYIIVHIEDSFHYQRVREIIYVLETANISKINDDKALDSLWEVLCCSKDNQIILEKPAN